jgi:uncharacterized protein (TIGR02145 family)
MKQLHSVLLFFLAITSYAQRIENVTFVNQGNTIVITYDFEGCTTDDTYMIQVKFKEQGGGEVVPKTLSGDIQKVTCGSKRIVWDVFKDRSTFEGKYYVELTATIMPKGPTDSDGYTYKTVQIGDQVWFAENLRTSKYNDGTPIPNVTDNNAWSKLNTGAYCFYDNYATNNVTYGKLYNWYAVETDKLCPTGWHVPTNEEWTTLSEFLGGEQVAGKKLLSISGWSDNGNGTNESGFSALPGGERYGSDTEYYEEGTFLNIGENGYWWSSTELDTNGAYYLALYYYGVDCLRNFDGKRDGFSVRCLRD